MKHEPGHWDVRCGDAADLAHIASNSVDLVLTDPPYFDYIAYSELGHFYVPWLVRLGLVDRIHLSGFPSGQLAPIRRDAAAAAVFANELAKRLKEVVRVCKPSARFIFIYQNLNGLGWTALASALADAGIRPLRAWPMFGESGTGLHKHENSISWDCVLYCAITQRTISPRFDQAANESGEEFARLWKERLSKKGHVLGSGDLLNLEQAGRIIHAFNTVSGSSPRPIQVGSKVPADVV